MQRAVGVADRMADVAKRVVRPFMPTQHRDFYAQLPHLIFSTVDRQGRPWASMRVGRPGFATTPDDTHLVVSAPSDPNDPAQFETGDPIGILGIEPHTRRRNRANGRVIEHDANGFVVHILQSFGNCPRYITRRDPTFVREPNVATPTSVERSTTLDGEARQLIARADTFYVASFANTDGIDMDVSHRGGEPGFVRVEDDGTLTIPDYLGNKFFNTLGNFVSNPVAGLMFAEPETGDVLQLYGSVRIDLDAETASSFEGAERVWSVQPEQVVRRRDAVALRWSPSATDPA